MKTPSLIVRMVLNRTGSYKCYNNEQPYQEYFNAEKEPEDYETYGDELTSGFKQPLFKTNFS